MNWRAFVLGVAMVLGTGLASPQAESLENVGAKIKESLPAGWVMEISPLERSDRFVRMDEPSILIRTSNAVMVRETHPNESGSYDPESKANPHLDFVWMQLVARPFISEKEYADTAKRNEEGMKARLDFEKKLKEVRGGNMGPRPWPPRCYEPKGEDEKKLVREYEVLWMKTEPRELPTHWVEGMSFRLDENSYVYIEDANKRGEYDGIRKKLGTILKPYKDPLTQ